MKIRPLFHPRCSVFWATTYTFDIETFTTSVKTGRTAWRYQQRAGTMSVVATGGGVVDQIRRVETRRIAGLSLRADLRRAGSAGRRRERLRHSGAALGLRRARARAYVRPLALAAASYTQLTLPTH